MVELMGVEPTTSSMPRKRSPTELQPHSKPGSLYYKSEGDATTFLAYSLDKNGQSLNRRRFYRDATNVGI